MRLNYKWNICINILLINFNKKNYNKMSNTIKLLIIFFFSLKLSNLTITYIFSENSIYNKNKNIKVQNTTLEILNNGQYIIKGNCENTSIIINSNYVTLYIISSHLNSRFNPLILMKI